MALPATDVRLFDHVAAFFAKRVDLHLALEPRKQCARYSRLQADELTGVGAADGRHGTAAAQGRIPRLACRGKQATFLAVASTQVVAVEIFTFSSVGCFHLFAILSLELLQQSLLFAWQLHCWAFGSATAEKQCRLYKVNR